MTEQNKKIVNVEVLDLNQPGYGPQGKLTREQWRNECLNYLAAGKGPFEAWQQHVLAQCVTLTSLIVNSLITYSDSSQKPVRQSISNIALDFIGQILPFLNLDRHQFMLEVRFDYASFESEVSFRHSTFDVKNISFLKRLSDEHGQTDQALNFNAMELRAKRQLARV